MKKLILFFCSIALIFSMTSCSNKGEKMTHTSNILDFDTLWNYNKPAETRVEFENLLFESFKRGEKSYHFQLVTQLARTYSLEGNFDKAHDLLNQVESELNDDLKLVKVRYLLERGRTYRLSKEVEKSIPLFEESYNLASEIGEDNFAIDAAHMMAIAVDGFDTKMEWSLLALKKVEETKNERAKKWKGPLYNNIGWDYHESKQYDKALDMFQKGLVFREEQKSHREINIAKWAVARCLRSLEQYDKSLEIQLALHKTFENSEEKDGYVFEELGELYLLKNDDEKSAKFFALAYEYLSKDKWMMENEVERMARIKKLGEAL